MIARALLLAAALAMATAAAPAPQIALTFDDLPSHGPLPSNTTRIAIAQEIVAALRAAHVSHVWGFVNGRAIEKEPATAGILDAWRAAGFPLGNHGWSHMGLDQIDAPAFLAEVDRNAPVLEPLMRGRDWRWLRFPYLAEGAAPEPRNAVRAGLVQRGYRIAGVTMSFGDFLWNDAYARCVATGGDAAIARLEETYLAAATEAAQASRQAAGTVLGRDIPYVLLMHLGAFDARMLPRLLAQYRREGFRFVTLEQATRDPFYAAAVDPRRPPTPSLDAQLAARGVPIMQTTRYAPILSAICR